MAAGYLPIRVEGLKTLRADMKASGKGAVREFRKELAGAAESVVREARPKAPVGARSKGAKPHLKDSLSVAVRGDKIVIRSPLPYANLIHWGGSNPSRNSPSRRAKRRVTGRPFIAEAAEARQDELAASLATVMEEYLAKSLRL